MNIKCRAVSNAGFFNLSSRKDIIMQENVQVYNYRIVPMDWKSRVKMTCSTHSHYVVVVF